MTIDGGIIDPNICLNKRVSFSPFVIMNSFHQNLNKVSNNIQQRRMRIAGHYIKHIEETMYQLVLWQSVEGRMSRERKFLAYVGNLLQGRNSKC